jgi:tRNA A-37 threonylcarbamoyl transferase component Bud32
MTEAAFGPYRIDRLLGRGGMGEVYRAHDSVTDRVVALKVLRANLSADEEYAARFRRECRSAARINEAHVVPIHRFGEIDGQLYLDMRLVEGVDLGAWLREHGAMPPDAAVAVIGQVAQALDAAHHHGLVHRDVKPSNMMLSNTDGSLVDPSTVFASLLDFGIARPRTGAVGPDAVVLTRKGALPGSPSYIAPERLDGVEGDPRSDVYSLACVLYEALTAGPPFTGDLPALMGAHLHRPPPRPSTGRPGVPAGFDAVVATGMAKDPGERYPTAGELAASARSVLGIASPDTAVTVAAGDRRPPPPVAPARPPAGADGVTVRFGPGVATTSPTPPRPPGRTRTRAPRRRARRSLGGVLGTVLVIVAAVLFYLLQRQPDELAVLDAAVAPAAEPGPACDVTVDVVGEVRTNGRAGTITYQWFRSDGESTAMLTQTVPEGTSTSDVHLLWTLSGTGRYAATATLRVLAPNPVEAAGGFTYDCR